MEIDITWATIGFSSLIFFARIIDVSLATLRTINVIRGKTLLSAMFGFFEIVVWVLAAAQVLTEDVTKNMLNLIAFAFGYAAGNAIGVWIEEKLAMGERVIRIVSQRHGLEIINTLRSQGLGATSFEGEGRDGPVTLIYTVVKRTQLVNIRKISESIDPNCIFVSEEVKGINRKLPSAPSKLRFSRR